MPTIIGRTVDMDHDEPSHRQVRHGLNKLSAAVVAAAVPMTLQLTDAQLIHRPAHLSYVVVIAQHCCQQ